MTHQHRVFWISALMLFLESSARALKVQVELRFLAS